MAIRLIVKGIAAGLLACAMLVLYNKRWRRLGPDFRNEAVFWVCFAALAFIGIVFVSGGLYLYFFIE